MNTQSLNNLFSAMLDSQIETGSNTLNDLSKLELLASNGLSKKDKKYLLQSPILRYQYIDAKKQYKNKIIQEIKYHNLETKIEPLAASSKAEDTMVFSCASYRVTIYHNKLADKPWIILVQLKPDLLKIIGNNTTISLIDTSGYQWAKGIPDNNGELLVSQKDTIDLFQQATKYTLNLEVV